jgi:ribonuclease HII
MRISGYGPLAGPLVVTAVASWASSAPQIVCRDSKLYGRNQNWLRMARDIAKSPHVAHCSYLVWPADLMRQGYGAAMRSAYRIAIESVRRAVRPYCPRACIDGSVSWYWNNTYTLPKADATVRVVSIASCYGKAEQVKALNDIHTAFPEYGFDSHHGYYCPQHHAAIVQYGMIVGVHRFGIIAKMPAFNGVHLFKNPTPYTRQS